MFHERKTHAFDGIARPRCDYATFFMAIALPIR
jgi:hypothetical protein